MRIFMKDTPVLALKIIKGGGYFGPPFYDNTIIGLDKQLVNIFLPICFNMCFGCSKEPS